MITAVLMAILLVGATFMLHYSVLHWLSVGMARFPMPAKVRVLVIVLVALTAHVAEVVVYAAAFAFGDRVAAIGSFGGIEISEPLDYFYFSIVSYTSLGIGDVFPREHLRLLTGIEALNGLLLIAWSGSFVYIAMARLWPWRSCADT